MAFLSLIDTAATTVAQFVEARRSRLDELTSWTFRTPLFRVMLGWWLLGERPAGWAAMGLIATVAAMTVALHAQRQPRPCEQQAFGGTPTGNRRAPATRWAHKEAGNDDS